MTQARHPRLNFHDVIILGAGAAGLMCAGVAGRRGHQVLVLEQSRHPAEKIRISGGGRCNFTNLYTSPANFLSDNPRFCTSALSGYTQRDFIALVESYRIAWHEKTRGQLFCDGSSQQIIDMLLEECRKVRAQLRLGVRISAVSKAEDGFVVVSDQGEFRCRSLVVATGGPSIPKMGSSGFGYKIAEQFGLKIVPPRAGAGALDVRRRAAGAICGSVGRVSRGDRELRQDRFRRGLAFYASGTERSGHPADILLLARGPGHRRRYGAGDRRSGRAQGIAAPTSQAGDGDRPGRLRSEAAGAQYRGNVRRSGADR